MNLVRKVQVWVVRKDSDGNRWALIFKTAEARGAFWQPVTGGVERGETFTQAAARELREETGFDLSVRPLQYEFEFHGKDRSGAPCLFRESCFWAEWNPVCKDGLQRKLQPDLDPREHQAAEWVPIEEAGERLKYPSNVEALNRVLKVFRA